MVILINIKEIAKCCSKSMCLSVCLCEWRGFRFSVYLMICSSCSRQSVATLVILLFCFSGNTFIPFQDLLSLNYNHIELLFLFSPLIQTTLYDGVRKPPLALKLSCSGSGGFGGEVLVWSGSYVTSGLAVTRWLGLERRGVDSDYCPLCARYKACWSVSVLDSWHNGILWWTFGAVLRQQVTGWTGLRGNAVWRPFHHAVLQF